MSLEEPKFSLRLIVDEKKKKVVFAEACSDFVDILFSLLTLPMGTIVRLLEKHRKSGTVTVGCFGNLYKSVVGMGFDDFETEACKQILLNPRSVKEVQCKRLKLSINPSDDLSFFKCASISVCKQCSNFSNCRCRCGKLMNHEIQLAKSEQVADSIQNGVFVRGRSSFVITDDLKVAVRSTELVLKELKSLGYGDVSKLDERILDIGLEEVMNLLQRIFSSNAPLTDSFLNKQITHGETNFYKSPSVCMEKNGDEAEPEKVITFSAVVRKQDKKILYVECGEDFVDLLFTFLAVPLESVLEISGNISTFGCIGNLFKSSKDLSATQVSTSNAVLHHYYRCEKQLLNIITEQPPLYHRYCGNDGYYRLTTNGNQVLQYPGDKLVPLVLMDPKSHGFDQSTQGLGFVKRDTKFTVSDDLIVTPMNSSSTFWLLKNLQSQAEDLEVQEMSISKTEATSLLRAALATSSVLNSTLWNLTLKNPQEDT